MSRTRSRGCFFYFHKKPIRRSYLCHIVIGRSLRVLFDAFAQRRDGRPGGRLKEMSIQKNVCVVKERARLLFANSRACIRRLFDTRWGGEQTLLSRRVNSRELKTFRSGVIVNDILMYQKHTVITSRYRSYAWNHVFIPWKFAHSSWLAWYYVIFYSGFHVNDRIVLSPFQSTHGNVPNRFVALELAFETRPVLLFLYSPSSRTHGHVDFLFLSSSSTTTQQRQQLPVALSSPMSWLSSRTFHD